MMMTFEPIQIFQPLSLLHVGMQNKWTATKKTEDRTEATNAVLAVGKHKRAACKLANKVEEIEVLVLQCACQTRLRQ